MDKIILLSVVFVSVVAPILGARSEDPRRGLILSLIAVGVFNLGYAIAVFYILPRIL